MNSTDPLDSIEKVARKWVALGQCSAEVQMAIGHQASAQLSKARGAADLLVVFTEAASRVCTVNLRTFVRSLDLAREQLENALDAAMALHPGKFARAERSKPGGRSPDIPRRLPPYRAAGTSERPRLVANG